MPGRRRCRRRRWSLTPPFHPDLQLERRSRLWSGARPSPVSRRSFSVALSASCPARVLPDTVLCGARTFLGRQSRPRPLGQPTELPHHNPCQEAKSTALRVHPTLVRRGLSWMPQAIGSLSGRVGAKHSHLELNGPSMAPRRMLRPYASPGIIGAEFGQGQEPSTKSA